MTYFLLDYYLHTTTRYTNHIPIVKLIFVVYLVVACYSCVVVGLDVSMGSNYNYNINIKFAVRVIISMSKEITVML